MKWLTFLIAAVLVLTGTGTAKAGGLFVRSRVVAVRQPLVFRQRVVVAQPLVVPAQRVVLGFNAGYAVQPVIQQVVQPVYAPALVAQPVVQPLAVEAGFAPAVTFGVVQPVILRSRAVRLGVVGY